MSRYWFWSCESSKRLMLLIYFIFFGSFLYQKIFKNSSGSCKSRIKFIVQLKRFMHLSYMPLNQNNHKDSPSRAGRHDLAYVAWLYSHSCHHQYVQSVCEADITILDKLNLSKNLQLFWYDVLSYQNQTSLAFIRSNLELINLTINILKI